MVYLPRHDVLLVFGGEQGSTSGVYLTDTWVYDVSANGWTQLQVNSPTAARFVDLAYDQANDVVVAQVANGQWWLFRYAASGTDGGTGDGGMSRDGAPEASPGDSGLPSTDSGVTDGGVSRDGTPNDSLSNDSGLPGSDETLTAQGGCGCNSAGPARPVASLFLLTAILLLVGRRRRC